MTRCPTVQGSPATFDDVAARGGVGIGTVYRRFLTKEALVEVALEERLADLAAAAEDALRAPTGWEGLTTLMRKVAEMHAADRGLRDVALGAHFDDRHHERIGDRMGPLLRQLVERTQAEGRCGPTSPPRICRSFSR